VVARKMQQGPLLLGRLVTSVDAAVAAAAEGANFVLLQVRNRLLNECVCLCFGGGGEGRPMEGGERVGSWRRKG
jgi:hypothetical protein